MSKRQYIAFAVISLALLAGSYIWTFLALVGYYTTGAFNWWSLVSTFIVTGGITVFFCLFQKLKDPQTLPEGKYFKVGLTDIICLGTRQQKNICADGRFSSYSIHVLLDLIELYEQQNNCQFISFTDAHGVFAIFQHLHYKPKTSKP